MHTLGIAVEILFQNIIFSIDPENSLKTPYSVALQ